MLMFKHFEYTYIFKKAETEEDNLKIVILNHLKGNKCNKKLYL